MTAILKTTSLTTICCQKTWKSGCHYFSIKIEKTTNPSNIMIGLISKKQMNTSQTYFTDFNTGYGYFAKDGKPKIKSFLTFKKGTRFFFFFFF